MSLDKFTAFVPIVAVSLAITFDAGYFWGLDINFFTLFSLSEHLVFAMQEIPLVIAVMVGCFLALPIFFRTLFDVGEKPSDYSGPKRRLKKWAVSVWYAFLVCMIGYYWWTGEYALVAVDLFF